MWGYKRLGSKGESPNFGILASHDPMLLQYAARAELYVFSDPNTALIKLRQFAETLARSAAARLLDRIRSERANGNGNEKKKGAVAAKKRGRRSVK